MYSLLPIIMLYLTFCKHCVVYGSGQVSALTAVMKDQVIAMKEKKGLTKSGEIQDEEERISSWESTS